MSDYIDETPLTDEEIAAAIAAAKKAKAEKAKAQKAKLSKAEKPEKPQKPEAADEESSENLFDEIDSAAESEEKLSPKMKSAKSFSNAFAAARSKREKELLKKKAEKEEKEEEEQVQVDVMPAQTYDEESEEAVVFEADDESEDYEEYAEYEEAEEYEAEEDATEFEVDGEEEECESYGDDDEEYEGIFEPDEEDTPNYGERVSVDEYEDDEDDEDDEDEDDDDDESTFSTKTKVIIGIIIAILVLAIIGAGIVFLSKGGDNNAATSDTPSASDGTTVTSLSFAEPSVSLKVGESAALNIVIEPETATDKTLKLKSSDTSIVTVGEDGKITGVASGSATVTATLKSNETITATLVVNVIDEEQNAINIYNNLINSILDGSTDIDSDTDESTGEEDTDTEGDSDSDSDTDSEASNVSEDILTGSLIKDLNSDGELELALLYSNKNEGSTVRIFYLADEGEEEDTDEVMYDEYGNIIENTETDTEEETDSEQAGSKEKILTELNIYSEMYSVCYNAIEADPTGWNTCFAEIKEEEVVQAKVTILSEGYQSPTFVYESSDESIATVDNQGNIKGVKPGTCFVTVTSPLNSEAMAKIKIRVKDDTDLLDDYLAQVPVVNSTNDAVIPTETLIGKAIVDIDNDGVSELLLRFSYGNNVETINMVKVENEQCVVYKTYNNLSDLYDYYEGDGSYSNSILIHYTTGAVCMEYKGIVAKSDSKTKTSEQKIFSVEDSGSLSELVNFTTTTDISTKTVTSEVVIEDTDSDDNTSSYYEDSDEWYDSDYYYDDSDDYGYDDSDDSYDDGYDDNGYNDYYEGSYAVFTFDDIVSDSGINLGNKTQGKTLPQTTGEPNDDGDYDYDDNDYTSSEDEDYNDEPVSRVTSTVTSEVVEETTKYFVNGTPVEQSVYEETLSSYSARYSVWSAWESV